jgi:GMP synthase-like glutamine amidotransferase
MNPVLIFRHAACEGPGYLADFLGCRSIPFEIVPVDEGAPVPKAIRHVSGLVFMGGPMSVNDDLPWIREELAVIGCAVQARLPVLGHCLGGQLISKALGGVVGANPVREIGWLPVERLNNTAAEDWLGQLPERFPAFHWHGETFSIPRDATWILKSEDCDHQAFVRDNVLALQCHVEMTPEMVIDWAARYANEVAQPSATVQTPSQMTERLMARAEALRRVADTVYSRWIQPFAPRTEPTQASDQSSSPRTP